MKTNHKLLNDIYFYLENKGLWLRSIQKVFFLLELNYFHKENKPLMNIDFRSYNYGPYSSDIEKIAEEYPHEATKPPKNITIMIEDILSEYKVDTKNQNKEFNKLLKYIHSLFIYNITPFDHKLKYNLLSKDDILLVVNTEKELKGNILKDEKEQYKKIRNIQISANIKKLLLDGN